MRLLIVDDDPEQLRSLSRVLKSEADVEDVITASGGSEAIEMLLSQRVDLVLTDLQMPPPSGLDLVQWIFRNQPHVTVFAMTAFLDDPTVKQLEASGAVECLSKPLDIAELQKRLHGALSDGPSGQIRNIGLPSLLQLIEMERKTCTLILTMASVTGHLFFRDGALVDAKYANLEGNDAAREMVMWPCPGITIISTCATRDSTVTRPAGFLVMDAMRIMDEQEHTESQRRSDLLKATTLTLQSIAPKATSRTDRPSLSRFPPPQGNGVSAMAVVDQTSGEVLFSSGTFENLDAIATVVARIFTAELKAAELLGEPDGVEEIVLTASTFCAVFCPLEQPKSTLALSLFDPEEATIAMERFELSGLAAALADWHGPDA